MREQLSQAYMEEENWRMAATCLGGIPLESSTRVVDDGYKLRTYVKMAELHLEDDEPGQAEQACNRAAQLLPCTTDATLRLRFKVCHTRILDAKRKFLDAAYRYLELSTLVPDAAEQLLALRCAVDCGILAGAGPRRSRLLALLCKDERTRTLPSFPVLEKMFHGRMVRREELALFEAGLRPHQMALTHDGQTLVERAVTEHNLVALSALYDNIGFEGLGRLLGLGVDQAEALAARMVGEGSLAASLDQATGLVSFQSGQHHTLARWDDRIHAVCAQLTTVLDTIAKTHGKVNSSA